MKRIGFVVLLSALAVAPSLLPAANAQNQLWLTQFGTSEYDTAASLASDGAGGVMIAGTTTGILGGHNAGSFDAFLARYDDAGTRLWIRQFGTSSSDWARAVAPDGAGGVMVAGMTRANLGGSNAGYDDAFLARFDSAGVRVWIRQFGSDHYDYASALAPDGAGGVMVAGVTQGDLGGTNPLYGNHDVFLARYDGAGNQLWIRQLGTVLHEIPGALAPDGSGGVMIAGSTDRNLGGSHAGGYDAFLARYDSAGNQVWLRQFGTSASDGVGGLEPDGAGGVMVAGHTGGSLGGPSAGGSDAYLARYDSAGNQVWIRQFGTSSDDGAGPLAPDGAGGVIVGVGTRGSLGGPIAGEYDSVLARYDSDGNRLWIRQFGTIEYEALQALAPDDADGVFVAGNTDGDMGAPNLGSGDIFLARYEIDSCYADCDQSTGPGVLDVFDFLCFQNSFVNSEPYACDCDTSTGAGVCDVFDFLCFQNAFVGGCP